MHEGYRRKIALDGEEELPGLGQPGLDAFPPELLVFLTESVDDVFVFFGLGRTRTIDYPPAGSQESARLFEQVKLRGLMSQEGAGRLLPFGFRVPFEHAQSTAGGIHEDPIEGTVTEKARRRAIST